MKTNSHYLRQIFRKHWIFRLLAWTLVLVLLAPPLSGLSVHAQTAAQESPEGLSEDASADLSENASENISEDVSREVSEPFFDDISENTSEEISGDPSGNIGEETVQETAKGGLCVTGWGWDDAEGLLTWNGEEGLWGLALPGANEANPVTPELLLAMLPESITAETAAGPQTVSLNWDVSGFPDGAFTGDYTLTAGLEGEYALAGDAPIPEVLVQLGGAQMYADRVKYLNQWSFIARDGAGLSENAIVAATENLSEKTSDEILDWLKSSVLPQQVRGWSVANDPNKVFDTLGFLFEDDQTEPKYETLYDQLVPYPPTGSPETAYKWGHIGGITWEYIGAAPASFHDNMEIRLRAVLPTATKAGDSYHIYVNSNIQEDHNPLTPDKASTRTNPDILSLTVTLRDLDLEDHIVPPANPANITVDLFDYWAKTEKPSAGSNGDILSSSDEHYHEEGSEGKPSETTTHYSNLDDWNVGINAGHLLLFGDGMIHAGLWNKGAGENCRYGRNYAGMEGIVRNVLTENGYPELNLAMADKILTDGNPPRKVEWIKDYRLTGDHTNEMGTNSYGTPGPAYNSKDIKNLSNTVIEQCWGKDVHTDAESLQYLFDPTVDHPCKTSYTDVTGLFQLDDDGYYYYDMRRNFAEFRADTNPDGSADNRFVLYDAPATIRTDASQSIGNFFPFNTGSEVFTGLAGDGSLTSSVACSGNSMNHHLGMTINADFRQPAGGSIHTGTAMRPMTFEFSGDDDVWVFIDDVLILDLGGIHSEIYGTVDFSTGDVYIGRSFDTKGIPDDPENPSHMVTHTTLLDAYRAAGREDATSWRGNTFASNTSHTLRMFYLERGNYDSSIALRFNLQPLLYQRIEKIDQNGQPLPDVEFTLHPAYETNDTDAIRCLYTDAGVRGQTFFVRPDYDETLITIKTDADGSAVFQTPDGGYFNFADRGDQYYVLRETTTPDGYRAQPIDIVLSYDSSTSMLSVANRWTTGAYACSIANLTAIGRLRYGYRDGAVIQPGSEAVPVSSQANGLVVAIPLLQKTSDQSWLALSGSNMGGFHSTVVDGSTEDAYTRDILEAALKQAASDNVSGWHLKWDEGNSRLYGALNDLPGLASRYQFNNPDGDMNIVYGILSPEALQSLGISTGDADARYDALRQYLAAHTTEDALSAILNVPGGFRLLSTNQFGQDFRSLIYIPNERRELQVLKVDQDGNPLSGAQFGLYDNAACSGIPNASGYTASDGRLIFSPTGNSAVAGQARMVWANSADNSRYYLKEMSAPTGYAINPTVIPVVVGAYSIYADAGTAKDGVSVMASVGRLTQTMRQYAMDSDVDVTLQDITAFMQIQPSGRFQPTGWLDDRLAGTSVVRSMNLHFGKNTDMDYGLHDEDGGQVYDPFFVTDTGFIRTRIQQNYAALNGGQYEGGKTDVNKDNLGDTDITNLFSLLNIVVVTDPTDSLDRTGQLTVGKMLPDGGLPDSDYTKNFVFTLQLQNPDGSPLTGSYYFYFYGDDKAGYIKDGGELILHHDERVTILGLPAGVRYTVTEKRQHGWYPTPESGTFSGQITGNETSLAVFTNTKQPPDPVTPGDPGTGTPGLDEPAAGVPGAGGQAPGVPVSGRLTQPLFVGDKNRPGLWLFCAALSLGVLILLGHATGGRPRKRQA